MGSILEEDSDQDGISDFIELSAIKIMKVSISVIITLIADATLVRFLESTHGSVNLNRSFIQTMNYQSQNITTNMSIYLAFLMISSIIIVTTILLGLYYYGFMKIILCWMVASVSLILSNYVIVCFGKVPKILNFPMDYLSLSIFILNLVFVGDMSIFWRAPKIATQFFLIIISVLIAIVFLSLPDWTVWILLCLLVVYDACVVLCPHGLLNLLIKKSEERNDSIPALVYSTAAYFFSQGSENYCSSEEENEHNEGNDELNEGNDEFNGGNDELNEGNDKLNEGNDELYDENEVIEGRDMETTNVGEFFGSEENSESSEENIDSDHSDSGSGEGHTGNDSQLITEAQDLLEDININIDLADSVSNSNSNVTQPPIDLALPSDGLVSISQETKSHMRLRNNNNKQQLQQKKNKKKADKEDNIRLGLGDFCFYGILVTRAARLGWDLIILCIFAVVLGLSLTLLVLAWVKRPLPALPFSLVLGIIFFMIGALTFRPFNLLLRDSLLVF